MTTLHDKLQLYLGAARHAPQVLEARWNKAKEAIGVLSPEIEAEALRRKAICYECPLNSINARSSTEYYQLFGQAYSASFDADDLRCGVCLCPIEAKVLAMSASCGLADYNTVYPQNPQPLKWDKVTTN